MVYCRIPAVVPRAGTSSPEFLTRSCDRLACAAQQKDIAQTASAIVAAEKSTLAQGRLLPPQTMGAVVEGVVIEAQNQILMQARAFSRKLSSPGERPMLLRNSRVLIFLSFLGSLAAFGIALGMAAVALTSIFPLSAINSNRFAAGALWALGAWLMTMSVVFLWRQGRVMTNCSVLLDSDGAHFKFGSTGAEKEVCMPWNGIAAVRYKRIPNVQKFTILGTDTSMVTFTSSSFYRPKKVARLIAERAGLPVVRG